MTVQVPRSIQLRNGLASPPPTGATFASFVFFASFAALVAMVYVGGEWWWGAASFGFSSDLGWTRAVFARNLAAGHILSFNPGIPVAGAAAPAWIFPLGLVGYLAGYILAAKVLGVVCVILTAFLVWRITLDLLGDWRFAFLAGLLVITSPQLMSEALTGTEGALAAMLVAAVIYWQGIGWGGDGRTRMAAAVAVALAALTRPELILLLPLLLVDRWLIAPMHTPQGRRLASVFSRSFPEALGAAALLAPYVLYNLHSGGPLWQRPEMALRAQPVLAWTTAVVESLWASNPLLPCAAVLGLPVAALAGARAGARYPSFLPVLAPVVLLLAPGFIWRHLAEENATLAASYLVPVVAVLSSAGLFFVKRAAGEVLLKSRKRVARIAFGTGVGLTLAALSALMWVTSYHAWEQHGFGVKKVNDLQAAIGTWVAAHTAPDASIASRDIGAIAYFSRRRMIDLGGTVDDRALDYLRRSGSPDTNLLAFMEKTEPSYLAIRPSDFKDLSQRVDLMTPAVTCSEPDPFAGGSTTWVLYQTPWPALSTRVALQEPTNHDSGRHRRR